MFAETVPSIGINKNKDVKFAKTHYSKEPVLYKTSSQMNKTSNEMPQKSEHFGLPDAGTWHVPMTFVNVNLLSSFHLLFHFLFFIACGC
jgi:hypothetical protein